MLDRALTTRLRKQIEWHFYNFSADVALYNNKAQDVICGGLTANLSCGGRGGVIGNPTESKAMRLEALQYEKNWATVVRNTFDAFRFEPEYEVMVALYIDGRKYNEIFCTDVGEASCWRWRDKWLGIAYNWAKEFKLL